MGGEEAGEGTAAEACIFLGGGTWPRPGWPRSQSFNVCLAAPARGLSLQSAACQWPFVLVLSGYGGMKMSIERKWWGRREKKGDRDIPRGLRHCAGCSHYSNSHPAFILGGISHTAELLYSLGKAPGV